MTTLVAIWPIVDPGWSREHLVAEALADLPMLAARAHARLVDGPRSFDVRDGRRMPGSGGARWVLVCHAPAEPLSKRDYWRRAS